MSSIVRSVTFDCADAYTLAGFWAEVFDCPRQPDDLPGDPEVMLLPPGGPMVLFIEVPEGKTVKNRVHLCLEPADRRRDAEVDRLLAAGATQVADLRQPDGTGWVVLADPEGNEFCVLRSTAERAAETPTPDTSADETPTAEGSGTGTPTTGTPATGGSTATGPAGG